MSKNQKPQVVSLYKGRNYAGTDNDEITTAIVHQAVDSLWLAHASQDQADSRIRATAATLEAIAPRDVIEGQIAAQLVAAHNAAMECYRRAMIENQSFEGRRENLNQANRLSRTHATLLEALNRHRGKGQQKVTVEHVHVHAGGQAIVGAVEAGGRARPEIKDQPHEPQPLPHAASAPVLGTVEADRAAVPSASRTRL